MIRNALLGGTAIVAATLATDGPARAGAVGTGDNMSVSIYGEYRFHIVARDQDQDTGIGRGYAFRSSESELGLEARNTADNGILYGVELVLNFNTDDIVNADKAYGFIDSEPWGRLEIGDQDDAIDRMFVGGEDALVGRLGFDADEIGGEFNFGGTWIGVQNNNTDKTTKFTYFSPRVAGFQLGASFTPDSGAAGSQFGTSEDRDDDGDFEKVFAVAANYVGEFEDVSVVLSVAYEIGDGEPAVPVAAGAGSVGDAKTVAVGGTVSYAGFTFGAGYVELNEAGISSANQALGEDAGAWWSVGLGYRSGPWGLSLGYYEATLGNVAGVGDTENRVISIDAEYVVAPGWTLMGNLALIEAENIGRTAGLDNDGHLLIFYNSFTF